MSWKLVWNSTIRDVNRAQIYVWCKGIKTLYYIRLRQAALTGTEVEGCVSCMLLSDAGAGRKEARASRIAYGGEGLRWLRIRLMGCDDIRYVRL